MTIQELQRNWPNWTFKIISNPNELKEVWKQYIEHYHTHFLFDTETNGLRIGENQDWAFIISFGWLDEDLKTGHAFVFETNSLTMKVFFGMIQQKHCRYVHAWNTKFDLNILKNTEQHLNLNIGYQGYRYPNFSDGMAIWRITHGIEDDATNMTLKGIAMKEVGSHSKDNQNEVKAEFYNLNRQWLLNFKKSLQKKFPNEKFDSSLLGKIKNGDIFTNFDYVDYYYEYVEKHPEPTYFDVYKTQKQAMLLYAMVDIVIMGEDIKVNYPKVIAYNEVKVLDQENKIIPVIAQQERNGVPIDIDYLMQSRTKIRDYYDYIEQKLNKIIIESKKNSYIDVNQAGQLVQGVKCFSKPRKQGNHYVKPSVEFLENKLQTFKDIWNSNELINTNSSEQIKMYFFVMTGTPKESFDKQEMNQLLNKIDSIKGKLSINLRLVKEFIETLKTYRRIAKWGNTYVGRFIKWYKESKDGKVHPSFAPFKVLTGRFSSPFQQQPKDKIFDDRTGEELFSPRRCIKVNHNALINGKRPIGVGVADLAQVEMRVNAIWTIKAGMPDQTLIDSIFNGVDLHKRTAAAAFHPVEFTKDIKLAESLVTKDERQNAKAINFGMQYGGGMTMVRNNPNITEDDGKRLFKAFNDTRKGTIHFQHWAAEEMLKNNIPNTNLYYVTNLFGRIYYASKEWVETESYRVPNYLIQGSCAYALKHSMVEIQNYIWDHKLDSQLILNIHDEVQLVLVEGEEFLMGKVKELMEDMPFAKGILPIKADLEFYKDTWDDKINIEMNSDGKNFHKIEEGKA